MLIFRKPPRFAFNAAILKAATTPLERLIDRAAPAMRRAIRQAIQTAQGRIDMDALARAIEQGRISRAVLDLDVFTADDLAAATELLTAAMAAGAALAHADIKGALALNVTNPEALAAAEAQAAALLTSANAETKQIVRDLIARAYREQMTAADTARLIRDVVGLNARQATALANYRAGLVEDGLTPDRIATLADRYAERLLRERADMIARAEIHRASAEGQHELWRQAVRDGLLNPANTKRIWIANLGACFTADSLIMTKAGARPIGSVRVGDYVIGRRGRPCRVLATRSIPYLGRLVRGPQFSCTPDHRLLSDDGAWWPACEYVGDAASEVGDDARTQESQYGPSALTQVVRLPFIFPGDLRLRVPVVAISEDDYAPRGDHEVGSPTTVERNLLPERDAGISHSARKSDLDSGWLCQRRKIGKVAFLRAEIRASWPHAAWEFLKSFAASSADNQNLLFPSTVAAPAVPLPEGCSRAGLRTVSSPASLGFVPFGLKRLATYGARLLDKLRDIRVGSLADACAGVTTPTLASADVAARDVFFGSADLAPIGGSATIRSLHRSYILSRMSAPKDDYAGLVYDITVEGDHSFVLACGLVAHNCEWCSDMADINADGVGIDEQFETPDGDMIDGPEDSHPACRCSTGLEFGEGE